MVDLVGGGSVINGAYPVLFVWFKKLESDLIMRSVLICEKPSSGTQFFSFSQKGLAKYGPKWIDSTSPCYIES